MKKLPLISVRTRASCYAVVQLHFLSARQQQGWFCLDSWVYRKALRGSQGQNYSSFVRHPAFLFEQKLSRERDVTALTKYTVSKTANFLKDFGKGGLPLILLSALKGGTTPVQIFLCRSLRIETGVTGLL